jgi:glycosyltransferase involved in cell wall biosynthesis
MRFVIEALGLKAAGGQGLGLNFLSRLHQFDQHQFVLFLPRQPQYAHLSGPNVRCIYYAGPWNLVSRHWALQRTLPGICAEYGSDALLCLGNFAPHRPPCPTAVLIQNAYTVYDEPIAKRRMTFREKLICAYAGINLRRLPNRVHVVVQTPVMRAHLLSRLSRRPLNPVRITIIPAPCDFFSDSLAGLPPHSPSGTQPFTFLCLARYYAHKNLEILPEALKKASAFTSRPFRCLITISPSQHPGARKLLDLINKENLRHVLVNVGPIPRCVLARVFRSADALILPSLLESYGCVYSEAMRFGIPILTSDRDFGRHVCRDAALYFDPLDPESVARKMLAVMSSPDLRQRLVRNGARILSKLPHWNEIAAQFIDVLERVAQPAPNRPDGRFAPAGQRDQTGPEHAGTVPSEVFCPCDETESDSEPVVQWVC